MATSPDYSPVCSPDTSGPSGTSLDTLGPIPIGLGAAIDLFTDIDGDAHATRVIEVNSNPSIRLLEQSGRGDLILKIWHHTLSAMGLL